MTMLGFHILFPDEAKNQCRAIITPGDDVLPQGQFVLMEAYCAEPGCDCRCVLISVVDLKTHRPAATIMYSFDPPEPSCDEDQIFLDPLSPQSRLSDAFFEMVADIIASDAAYGKRLEWHYAMWKRVVDNPWHPAQEIIRTAMPGSGFFLGAEPIRRLGPKIGRNDPCPCGSGRKYKKCCRDARI